MHQDRKRSRSEAVPLVYINWQTQSVSILNRLHDFGITSKHTFIDQVIKFAP